MPLIFTGLPESHTQHKQWVDKGRPPLKDLAFGKASGMVFPFMEIVKGNDRKHEEQLATWFKLTGHPIRLFDFDDEDLLVAYWEAHPDEIPDTLRKQAKFMAQAVTRDGPPGVVDNSGMDIAAALRAESSGSLVTVGKRARTKAGDQARAESGREMRTEVMDRDARFASVYESKVAEHVAGGKSQKQAAFYAERSATAAAKQV